MLLFVGALLAIGILVTQVAAIGPKAAWLLHRGLWLKCLLIPPAIPFGFWGLTLLFEVAVRVALLPFQIIGWGIDAAFGKNVGDKARRAFAYVGGWSIGIGIVASIGVFFFGNCYNDTKNGAKLPTAANSAAASQVKEVVSAQASANAKLSDDAEALLKELDDTEQQIAEARKSLRGTLQTLANQKAAIEHTSQELDSMAEQEKLIRIRHDQLRDLLNGEEPITRSYFDKAGWESLFIAAVIGGLISHAPAIWNRMRRRKGSPLPETPPKDDKQLSLPMQEKK